MANLRGKNRQMLMSSVDSALLAVEVYNKPRTTFRSEAYITLMIMAWTRLFHVWFRREIGERYFWKKNGRYELVDGERKSWELSQCIREYKPLKEPVRKNLQFFIKLRNKVEHRHIDRREVDTLIFGECQALLYNYETLLLKLFGRQYAINESLVYSLQFSHLRTPLQRQANRAALSDDVTDIVRYVESYRASLTSECWGSQEYSIRVIVVPRISNTNRSEAAIEFVKWDDLSDEDRDVYSKVAVLVKDRKVIVPAVNVGRMRPGAVVTRVNELLGAKVLTQNLHTVLYKLFRVRPARGVVDPAATVAEFCVYDEPHGDYLYHESWVELLVHFFQIDRFTAADLRERERGKKFLDIETFRPL